MWETHGLMTRIHKADFRTICNRLRLTISLTEERLQMSLAPRFLNEDVAQMAKRSLCMRELRRSMPHFSNFTEEPGNRKRKYGGLFCKTKRRHRFERPICKRKHLKQYRACWKSDWCPESPRFTQKDVDGNITPAIRESKTSLWHKQLLWTLPVRHDNRKGKPLACEKHLDWWPASTKAILERYAIAKVYLRKTSKETLLHWEEIQRHPADIKSSFGTQQRGISIGRASDWHVRNT